MPAAPVARPTSSRSASRCPRRGPRVFASATSSQSGELVVTLASNALAAAGKAPSASSLEASFGMRAVAGAPDREMLFQLPDDAAARARTLQSLAPASAGAALPGRFAGLSGAQREKLDTLMASKALARRADVALAEPNFIRHALVTPNDPLYGLQWHYPLINLPAAWDLTTGSTNVKVAVIDTGVLHGHPDLQGQLAPGFDFISNAAAALDGNGIDPDPEDPGDGGGVSPSSFHGTHVAGTIGAKTQNAYGVAGVAWNVTLVPLRVLGFGGGTDFDILQAVRYAAGLANNSGTSNKVDVINLSLGGTGYSQTAQNVFTQARSAGVIVVAAAGNNDSSQLFYPASYDGVVSVSAVDLLKQKAGYSNFGTAVDVAAPGGDISADRNGDGYADGVLSTLKDELTGAFNFRFYNGTSMAAPHVAGVVALMKSVKPSLTPAEFDTLLASGSLTTDLGAAGRDDFFGNGLIDARKAVEAASASPPSGDPILLVSPTGLNLGTAGTQATFQATNGGGGTLSVTAVTDDQPWLTVAAAAVDGNGVGSLPGHDLARGSRPRHLFRNDRRAVVRRQQLGVGRDGRGDRGDERQRRLPLRAVAGSRYARQRGPVRRRGRGWAVRLRVHPRPGRDATCWLPEPTPTTTSRSAGRAKLAAPSRRSEAWKPSRSRAIDPASTS